MCSPDASVFILSYVPMRRFVLREGDISTGTAYELAIIYSIVHWTLMLHILTRPFKAERRRKVTEHHHEKERAALSPGVDSLGGSLSLQETRQNIGS